MNKQQNYFKVFVGFISIIAGFFFFKTWDHTLITFLNITSENMIYQNLALLTTTFADGLFVVITASLIYTWRQEHYRAVILALIISWFLITALKNLFAIQRPAFHYENIVVIGHFLQTYSFPSGHACTGIILATYLRGSHKLFYPFLLFGSCLALSRVWIGVHFVSDIWIGGWLGFGIFQLSVWLDKKLMLYINTSNRFQKIDIDTITRYSSLFIGLTASMLYIFLQPF